MGRRLFFLLTSLAWAAGPQPVLSPSANRIAYLEQCPQSENRLKPVVILDLGGRRLKALHPMAEAFSPAKPRASISDLSWVSETSVASECHINPSLSARWTDCTFRCSD